MLSHNARATVDQYARATAAKMEAYVQSQYNVPDFKLKVILPYGERRQISRGGTRGGKPFINIVCKRFASTLEAGEFLTDFYEYAHISNDLVIGNLKGVSWETALAALLAHEVAHAVQFFPLTKRSAMDMLGVNDLDGRNDVLEKHNWFWQRIYADLRTKFVNGEANNATLVVVTPKQARPQRTVNKGWKVVSQQKGKDRWSSYYTTSGELIGILCVCPGGYFRYHPDTKSFTKLNVKNFNEARKIEFGI